MKILAENTVSKEAVEKMKEFGEVTVWDRKNPPEVADVEVAIGAQGLKHIPWEAMKDLKAVFLRSVGIDYLPLDLMKERGIVLTNNRGAYALPIGEYIVMAILNMAKHTVALRRAQEERRWAKDCHMETLEEKTVLFLGTGTIPQEAAKRLAPFGVTLLGYNTSGHPVEGFHRVLDERTLEKGLAEADYLVICLPGTPETENFVDGDLLGKIKPGCGLVNIARGTVLEEGALLEALDQGIVREAVLDVFFKEPLPEDSPLWNHPKVTVTPHISYQSGRDEERKYTVALRNLEAYAKGEPVENQVDYERGY